MQAGHGIVSDGAAGIKGVKHYWPPAAGGAFGLGTVPILEGRSVAQRQAEDISVFNDAVALRNWAVVLAGTQSQPNHNIALRDPLSPRDLFGIFHKSDTYCLIDLFRFFHTFQTFRNFRKLSRRVGVRFTEHRINRRAGYPMT